MPLLGEADLEESQRERVRLSGIARGLDTATIWNLLFLDFLKMTARIEERQRVMPTFPLISIYRWED